MQTRLATNRFLKFFLTIGLCVVIGVGIYRYSFFSQTATLDRIVDFNDIRDTQPILDSFQRDWYWLVEGFGYSPEYMLANRASSQAPQDKGNMIIKVAYHGDEFVGFVAYFLKNFCTGDLRFLYVHPDFRGKKWGYKLLDYAIQDFAKRGVVAVDLLTRINNDSSRRLYTRYGFKETHTEGGLIFYRYTIKEKGNCPG